MLSMWSNDVNFKVFIHSRNRSLVHLKNDSYDAPKYFVENQEIRLFVEDLCLSAKRHYKVNKRSHLSSLILT